MLPRAEWPKPTMVYPFEIHYEQVTIADEGCIPAIVALLSSSKDVPTQYYALMTLCKCERVPPFLLRICSLLRGKGMTWLWAFRQ